MIADTPDPPYFAVIFTSTLQTNDPAYQDMASQMLELASRQAGFLGFESARDDLGISVSYWRDLHAIRAWKRQAEHRAAQHKGREDWYGSYKVRIARVERDYALI